MRNRDWTPVKRGGIYCSPACGMGCTTEMYNKAMKDADALCKRAAKEVGGEWVPDVWENLGWHYAITLKGGDITIHTRKLNGKVVSYWVGSHRSGTPIHMSIKSDEELSLKEMVDLQLKIIKAEADKLNDYLTRNTIKKK
jgi:hypothetical protein